MFDKLEIKTISKGFVSKSEVFNESFIRYFRNLKFEIKRFVSKKTLDIYVNKR